MVFLNFISMKLQSIDIFQILLVTDKQQDQERSILVNFCCQFKILIIDHAEGPLC